MKDEKCKCESEDGPMLPVCARFINLGDGRCDLCEHYQECHEPWLRRLEEERND